MRDTTVAAKQPALLTALLERQAHCGLSDYGFAQALGVSRQLWQSIRTGKRAIRDGIIPGILRTYPDLTDDVVAYLKDGSKEAA